MNQDRQNDVSPERLERIRAIDPTEDFGQVLGRARAKARGQAYDPDLHHPAAQNRSLEERVPASHQANLAALTERFMERARGMPRDAAPEPPRAAPRSAVDVRLSWYIPPRHREDTLENFRPITPSQKAALDATRAWIESVKAGRGGALALIGSVGSGKSHLLFAAIREVNLAGIHGAANGWYELADLFRRSKFGHPEDLTEARLEKDRYLAARALGIDEIRPTSGTEYDTTELSQLMTRAYRQCQGVIITSNFADEKLEGIIGLAAASRLTQVVITGPDMRQPENRRHLQAVR